MSLLEDTVELMPGTGVMVTQEAYTSIMMKSRRRFSLFVREVTRGLFPQSELSSHSALGKRLKVPGCRPGLDRHKMATLKCEY